MTKTRGYAVLSEDHLTRWGFWVIAEESRPAVRFVAVTQQARAGLRPIRHAQTVLLGWFLLTALSAESRGRWDWPYAPARTYPPPPLRSASRRPAGVLGLSGKSESFAPAILPVRHADVWAFKMGHY